MSIEIFISLRTNIHTYKLTLTARDTFYLTKCCCRLIFEPSFPLLLISLTLFTFPSASCWTFLLQLHRLPCHFYGCYHRPPRPQFPCGNNSGCLPHDIMKQDKKMMLKWHDIIIQYIVIVTILFVESVYHVFVLFRHCSF